MPNDLNDGADAQDQAEVFDETNITRDGDDIAHPDLARDVLDVTSELEDSRSSDDDDAAFDPDLADEAEMESLLDADDGVDDEGAAPFHDEGDLVSDEDVRTADFDAEGDGEGDQEGRRPPTIPTWKGGWTTGLRRPSRPAIRCRSTRGAD